MKIAVEIAKSALATGDVPVGALVLNPEGKQISTGFNRREIDNDPSAHAEIVALREAAIANDSWRLDGHTIVVTLEPCAMCAGAIAQARIKTLVFGAWDAKAGAVGSVWDVLRDPRSLHQVEVISGVNESECAALLSEFFKNNR
ncbi:MAG: nucleoside deaminase [Actinobacteria bacterium]|uniref:tRNA-specific adenosine deaminase 2 n=1 Tax=freshwater metagenome TaxID=449393 RepID=A0A6J6RU86_9ZZZZ|nr:nucleoside deaminase [Actinomycetota bacterium]MSZ01795.1 nucleoside deaminase [Actinomycetota bacterium]